MTPRFDAEIVWSAREINVKQNLCNLLFSPGGLEVVGHQFQQENHRTGNANSQSWAKRFIEIRGTCQIRVYV